MIKDYTVRELDGDRRQHERFEAVQAIYIEVASKRRQSEARNTIIRCETVDVSAGGLKIYVPQSIPRGSRLNIAVPLDQGKDNLELAGTAVWVKPAGGDNDYWVGLQLDDTDRDAMGKWFRVVRSLSDNKTSREPVQGNSTVTPLRAHTGDQ